MRDAAPPVAQVTAVPAGTAGGLSEVMDGYL
jgi:hypothetical protein